MFTWYTEEPNAICQQQEDELLEVLEEGVEFKELLWR